MQQRKKRNIDSMLIKGLIVAGLTILMLIPIALIMNLIEERAENKETATNEINSKWGGQQYITGPILVVPYTTNEIVRRKNALREEEIFYNKVIEYAYFLPDSYNVESDVKVEERARSIYNTLVYQSDNNISGTFSMPKVQDLKIEPEDAMLEDAFVIIGVPHMQGIKSKIDFKLDGILLEATPGVPDNSQIKSGLTIKTPLTSIDSDKPMNFEFKLNLNGSEKLLISPVGKENKIKIHSDWNTVSFTGDFLPSKREINDNGFDAQWDVFDYNRNYVQMWTGNNQEKSPEVGIELKFTVDQYQMSMRSVKYAIMFIVLTFVIFFLVEIITRRKIHPVQYALVSFALILFYTMLIALSEHISFHIAYLISAIAIVTMITLYVKTFFRKLSHTLAMGGFIASIYIYLYVILQLEDMALLIGVIGLFIALAAIMYASRKVDWYKDEDEEIQNTNLIA